MTHTHTHTQTHIYTYIHTHIAHKCPPFVSVIGGHTDVSLCVWVFIHVCVCVCVCHTGTSEYQAAWLVDDDDDNGSDLSDADSDHMSDHMAPEAAPLTHEDLGDMEHDGTDGATGVCVCLCVCVCVCACGHCVVRKHLSAMSRILAYKVAV